MEEFLRMLLQVNLLLQQLPGWIISLFHMITNLGSEMFFLLFMPFLYWCVSSVIGLRTGAMLVFSTATVNAAKMIFQTPRPYWLDTRVVKYVEETSFGVPSGHSAIAASIWGVLAASIKRKWVTILFIVLIFLIGVSRLVMGAHFLIDVLTGWLLGGLLLWVFLRFEAPVVAWFDRLVLRQQVTVALISSILMILPTMTLAWLLRDWVLPEAWQITAGHTLDPLSVSGTFTVAGTWGGFLTGHAWLRQRFGQYNTEGTLLKRLIRFPLGIIVLLVIWAGLDHVFPDTVDTLGLVLRYVRYFAVGYWVSAGAPLFFRWIKLARIDPFQPDTRPIA